MVEAPFEVLAQDWETTTLGEVAQRGGGNVQTGPFGSQLHASDYVAEGVPSIMPQNIGNNRIIEDGIARIRESDAARLSKYRLAAGDIVYSRRGDVERRSLVRSENDGWLCGTGCLRVRFGKRHVFPEYAAQYLGHPAVREWIVQHAVGATMPNLNTGILSAVPFVLPPMAVQVDIATVLSALDDKIELNRRMNETLEAMAQAIFRDWFVDFGPVRRKLAGVTDPAEIMGGLTPNPGRAAELAVLFPNQLNEHDLPSGWRCGAARDLLEFNPREQLRAGTPAPYSDMSSLPTRGTVAEPPITRPFGSGMRFRNGDALLARITPCLENGKGAWVDFLTDDAPVGWGSTEFIVMRGLSATPSPFGYLLSRDPDFRQHAIQSMTGTSGRQRAQVDSLETWPMAVPPAPVLRAFGEHVVPLFTRITAAAVENRTLAETRDYLLPGLMSGEVSVRAATDMVEDAA